jgi:uncharacterized protein (DUF1330 family)
MTAATTLEDREDAQQRRYYQLVFLWPTDTDKLGRYMKLAAPLVSPYGGRLDRQIAPETIYADGIERPTTINLVSNPTRELFDAFHHDEGFRAIVHLRSESTKMASVTGRPIRGAFVPRQAGEQARLYVVELARFGAGGEAPYRAYERESEPAMARHGYHVEREIRPDGASGMPFVPDIVKIGWFEGDGMAHMQADPTHARIEKELYPAAVAESIWVIGRATNL